MNFIFDDERRLTEIKRLIRGGYYPNTIGQLPVNENNIRVLMNEWKRRIEKYLPSRVSKLELYISHSKSPAIYLYEAGDDLRWGLEWITSFGMYPSYDLNDYFIYYGSVAGIYKKKFKVLNEILGELVSVENVQHYQIKTGMD